MDDLYSRAAYVTGQAGIGKTLFLAYILVTRLGKQQSVAWHLPDRVSNPCYVMLRETASCHHELDRQPLYKFSPVWALSDSSTGVTQPLHIFYTTSRSVKTIQTTAPEVHRWKSWSKYGWAECYVMDIWSEKEITDLARLLNLDVDRMTILAKEWGGAPWHLLDLLTSSDGWICRSGAAGSVYKCKEALPAIEANTLSDDVYFCRPARDSRSGVLRSFSRAVVPTTKLCTLLAEGLRRHDSLARATFFHTLRQCNGTRSAVGYIFENWFHGFVLASRTMTCHWLRGRDEEVTPLRGTNRLILTSWSDVHVARPPYYWIAPTDFPGIDCALVLQTGIYAIRVILSSDDRSPIQGLQKLREELPEDLRGLPWRVLFVGDDDVSARAVAKRWYGKVAFPSERASAIGWSALDPVDPESSWKEYRSRRESEESEATEEASMRVDE